MKIHLIEWFDDHYYKVEFEENGKPVTKLFPSVTTKLEAYPKPFLARWRGDIGNREADARMEEAARKGERSHEAWACLCKGGAVIYQPKKHPVYTPEEIAEISSNYKHNITILNNQDEAYDAFKLQRFLDMVNPKIIASEFMLCDVENGDAGTADTLMEISGGQYSVCGSKPITIPSGRGVVDLKTGSYVGTPAFIQVSVYALIAEKMNYGPIEWAAIAHTKAVTKAGIAGFNLLVLTRAEIERYYQVYKHVSQLWNSEFAFRSPKILDIPSLMTRRKDDYGD